MSCVSVPRDAVITFAFSLLTFTPQKKARQSLAKQSDPGQQKAYLAVLSSRGL